MRPVLCVRNEAADTLGVALETLEGEGVSPELVDAWAVPRWPDPGAYSAVAVFGGSMNADDLERHPYLLPERSFLAETLEAGVPLLAVCLGAQVLARTLGVDVVRAPRPELGFYPIEVTAAGSREAALAPFAPGELTFQWHEDTFELPPGATLLATGEHGGVQAYRIGSALAVQFHPEVTADEVEAWFEVVGDERLQAEWGRSRQDLRTEIAASMPDHNERGRELFRRFAQTARSRAA